METVKRMRELMARSYGVGDWENDGSGYAVARVSSPDPVGMKSFVDNGDLLLAAVNALPSMLDVVEAAERLAESAEWVSAHPKDVNGWGDLDRQRDLCRAALAALAKVQP